MMMFTMGLVVLIVIVLQEKSLNVAVLINIKVVDTVQMEKPTVVVSHLQNQAT